MNPEVAKIVGALNNDSFPTGGMSFINEDFPFGGMTLAPVAFPEPKVNPTVTPTLTMSSAEVPVASTQVNPTPYVKTRAVGLKLSETEKDELPDASLVKNALTKEQIQNYIKAGMYANKAIVSLANGFTAKSSYRMQARNAEWQAKQNERSAKLLLANQREINRAAQADANVYRMQGAQTKSKQKVAMAQSGFAVGKGIYRNTLDNTDIRVNYNTSAIMLKAELENAELTRKAGLYESEAIINRANRDIYGKLGRAALVSGILDSVGYTAASGAYFYLGKYPAGKTTKGEAIDPMQVKSAKNQL